MGHPHIRFYIRKAKERETTYYEILHIGGVDHQILLNYLFLRCIQGTLYVIRNMSCIDEAFNNQEQYHITLVHWPSKRLDIHKKISIDN